MNTTIFSGKIKAFIASFALLLVIGGVVAMSRSTDDNKIVTKSEKKLPPTTNWYSVAITGTPASNPANQQIGSAISGSPTAPCNEASGIVCAIRLTLDEGVSVPATVAQANAMEANNEGVDVLSSSFREEN